MPLVDPSGAHPFWGRQCSARQAGLAHVHTSDCDDGHTPDQCCECGHRQGDTEVVGMAPEATVSPATDHAYQFTIVGRCSRCHRPEADHLQFNSIPDERGCTVDHRSIKTALLIGDGGLEWTTCPICFTPVEARMITGNGPIGPGYGPGRGSITERLARKLGFVRWLSWGRP